MIRSIVPLFAFALIASVPALAGEIVALPHFDSVELRGGGDVLILPGPTQRVTIVDGSSRFTHLFVESGALKIDTCNADCPHHYRLRIEIESPRVPNLAISGGGALSVGSGFPAEPRLVAAVKGGGRIDARAVDAANVSAAVSGGGDLLVHASSTLSGAINGGGLVRYWGNPRVTSAIAGGGAIRPAH